MSVPYRAVVPLALAITVAVCACKSEQESDPRLGPRLVQVARAQAAGEAQRSYTGVVCARVQSDLGFRVQGKIVERLVDTGQVVARGQRLMRIDPTDYVHAITAQADTVVAARARWIQAAADEQRYRGLVASGAISKLTYDQAKAASDSARALLSAAEAQEKVTRNQGDYSTLFADADGTVVETLAEPGQVVAAGQTVIRLARAGAREAAVNLPETERPKLGSQGRASLYGGTVTVPAHLRQLSDSADSKTRTFEARYVLDGEGARAPLGATVTIQTSNTKLTSAVQVPLGAIDDEGRGPGIWVVDPKTSRISYRLVQVGEYGGEYAILSSGAHVGEQIVAVGGHFLREAERVQPVGPRAVMQ
jgi:RND family efflux transporter MFP subunit